MRRLLFALLLATTIVACTTTGVVDGETVRPATGAGPDDNLHRADQALARREFGTAAREFTLAAEQSESAAIAERATQFAFATGYDAWAERSVRRWIELVPESPLPREVLGRLLLRRYALDEAVDQFGEALGRNEPRRDELYLALAADLANEDNAPLVTRVLAYLTAQDPFAPGAQLALGNAALRSGHFGLAQAAAVAAGLDDPGWIEPRLLAARAQAAGGDVDGAIAALAELPRDDLSDPGAAPPEDMTSEAETSGIEEEHLPTGVLFEQARMLASAGRTADAMELVTELTARVGDQPSIMRLSALLALADGELDAAERELTALAGTGDPFEAYYYLGQVATRRDNAATALDYYRQITSGSYLLPARFAIAETHRAQGDIDGALEVLDDFGRNYPGQVFETLGYRAQLLQSAGRLDEALAVYDDALAYKPASVQVLLSRGALADEMGRLDEALADLARAVEIAPADAAALNAYGYTLANRTRRFRAAYDHIRLALELEPESAAIQDSMGWVLFRLGRLPEARSYLEEAYDRMPDPEVASHLAEVWWRLGERERAGELLRATLAEHPDSKPATDTARRLLR